MPNMDLEIAAARFAARTECPLCGPGCVGGHTRVAPLTPEQKSAWRDPGVSSTIPTPRFTWEMQVAMRAAAGHYLPALPFHAMYAAARALEPKSPPPASRLAALEADNAALVDQVHTLRRQVHEDACRVSAIGSVYFELLCAIDPSGGLVPLFEVNGRDVTWKDRDAIMARIREHHRVCAAMPDQPTDIDYHGPVREGATVPDPAHEQFHRAVGDVLAGKIIQSARRQMQEALKQAPKDPPTTASTTRPMPDKAVASVTRDKGMWIR